MRLIYTDADTDPKAVPNAVKHLKKFRSKISCTEVTQNKHQWWRLHRPRKLSVFKRSKIIGVTTSRKIELVYDKEGDLIVTDAMYVFGVRSGIPVEFVLGLMQSSPFAEFYRLGNQGDGRVIPQVKARKLLEVPLPRWDRSNETHKALVKIVRALMTLSASDAPGAARSFMAQRRELDALARKIYGVSDLPLDTDDAMALLLPD
ncbi:MAG: hypothetical protein HC869_27005 [Rhodospirillales bacterium]|nr:hypothetical protein [Rhodospirillales bacterium]